MIEEIRNYFGFSYNDKKIIFITLFVVSDLISNILAIKIFDLGFWGLSAQCATLLFPLGYLMSDVITEVYGSRTANKTIILGLFCNLMMLVFSSLAIIMPYPDYWTGQEAFEYIFGTVPRIVVASYLAYLIGQFTNVRLMVLIKKWTNGKYLFVRTIGSTIGGEFFDSAIFCTIGFWGTVPYNNFLSLLLTSYCIKVIWECVLQPITYKSIDWAKET